MDLEMAPPFKRSNPWKLNLLSKPPRLEGTKAARSSTDRWVAFGLLMWVHWGKGTMAKFPFQIQDSLQKTIFWFSSELTSPSREANYCRTPAKPLLFECGKATFSINDAIHNFVDFFEVTTALTLQLKQQKILNTVGDQAFCLLVFIGGSFHSNDSKASGQIKARSVKESAAAEGFSENLDKVGT